MQMQVLVLRHVVLAGQQAVAEHSWLCSWISRQKCLLHRGFPPGNPSISQEKVEILKSLFCFLQEGKQGVGEQVQDLAVLENVWAIRGVGSSPKTREANRVM